MPLPFSLLRDNCYYTATSIYTCILPHFFSLRKTMNVGVLVEQCVFPCPLRCPTAQDPTVHKLTTLVTRLIVVARYHSFVSSTFHCLLCFCWLSRYKPVPNSCLFTVRLNSCQKLIYWLFFFFLVILNKLFTFSKLNVPYISNRNNNNIHCHSFLKNQMNNVLKMLNPVSGMQQTFNR